MKGRKGYELKIRIENQVVDVTEEVYQAYYRMKNHEDYIERRDRENGLAHYQALDCEEMKGEDILPDENTDILTELVVQEEKAALWEALGQLKERDRELIEELYFNERTERELAEMLGVRQPAIHKRKVRILETLKSFLKKIDF